ncbi:MAG TPA: 3-hydroxyacyl-CoA dehydrogenase [Chromatiaceae bacterium]|nr:3-hydroxyacyl-CoA dehydrogenase [Chromatiaceae bacterium]
MHIDDIRHILVVGTGTMGQKIALQCARFGYEVTAYDASAKSLDTAKAKIPEHAADVVAQQLMTADEATAALSRITYTLDPEKGAKADLISESVIEDPELKGKVFAQFNSICPAHTLFTTNTSTLLPSMFAAATGRPDKFAALHFYGVWIQNLADIMPHPGTSPETLALLVAFAKRIGQVPILLKKEYPGYIGNTLLGALNDAAMRMVFTDKVATIEDVDRAAMLVLGIPAGPFGWLDHVGLDTLWHIMESAAKTSGDPGAQAFADMFKREYIDKGWLGVKSGKGFYSYPNPAFLQPDFLTGSGN